VALCYACGCNPWNTRAYNDKQNSASFESEYFNLLFFLIDAASTGRAVMNLISTSDSAMSSAPTADWIDGCGEDELELPLLTSDHHPRIVQFARARSPQTSVDGTRIMDSAATPEETVNKKLGFINSHNDPIARATVHPSPMSGINMESEIARRGLTRRCSM
jgi:hypothetical protein